MSLFLSVRSFALSLAALACCVIPATSYAGSPLAAEAKAGFESVELFEAMERGEVIATVHVRDAEQLNLAIENKTDRKLAVRMPDAFAAVPVHAQFQPGGGPGLFNQGNGLNNQGNGGQNQGVGGGFNQGNNGNNQNQLFNNPGFFNVPPGKIVRVKQVCVCLEHGKEDPNVRLDYEVRPIASVIEDSQTETLLRMLAAGGNRRVIQLAVWHRANGVSWKELAALRIDRVRQPDSRQYSSAEIEAASKLIEQVAELDSRSTVARESSTSVGRNRSTR